VSARLGAHRGRSRKERCMERHQEPDLAAMNEQEATRFLTELAPALSPEGEYRTRHPEDYVMEMPQSGERFRGRDNMRAFQEAFTENSAPPQIPG
jgi:hypothetical protein